MPDSGGMPGANFGGTNIAVPTAASSSTPAIGGAQNPFNYNFPSGQSTAPITQPITQTQGQQTQSPFPANGAVQPNNPALSQFNPYTMSNPTTPGAGWVPTQNDFVKALRKSGFSAGDAAYLFNFIQSGAGYNAQIAQTMIDAMQPTIQRGQANLLEQFGAQGLRNGSPAAIGLGDYLSQAQLNEGQILASMYEQAVSNYMTVLMGGKGQPPKSMMENILMGTQAIQNMAGASASAASAITGGGGK